MFRLFAAFAVAPIVPVLLLAPVIALIYQSLSAVGPYLFVAVVYGYPAIALFGLPLFALYRKKQWNEWWQILLAGALVGILVPALLISGLALQGSGGLSGQFVASALGMSAVGSGLGAGSGLAFWFIGIYGNKRALEP